MALEKAPSATVAAAPQRAGGHDTDPRQDTASASGKPMNGDLLHDEIARLAYSLWEQRHGDEGSPEEDWLRAEQKLRGQRVQVAAGSASGD